MNQNQKNNDEWSQYQNLVLNSLEKIDDWQETVNDNLTKIKIEIATLKVKAAMWGSIAAIVLTALLNFGLATMKPSIDQEQLLRIEKILKNHNNGNDINGG